MRYTLTGRFYFLLGTAFAFLGLCLLVFAAPDNPAEPVSVSAQDLEQTQTTAKEKTISKRPPVALLVFDEFPTVSLLDSSGAINKKRFPNISLLEKEGRWYKNHTTVSESTFFSVPSIMSGMYPKENEFPLYRNYPKNIFTYAEESNYDIYGRELLTELCKSSLCEKTGEKVGKSAQSQTEYMKKKIGQTGPVGRLKNESWITNAPMTPEMFFFLHAGTPHQPYHFLPSGETYNNSKIESIKEPGQKTDRISANRETIELNYARALLQVGYVDYLIGKFIKKAKRSGIWDEMLFIVVADHGSGWREGDSRRAISKNNMGAVAFAPLFIKYPGNSPSGTSEATTQNIDILPTILKEISQEGETDGLDAESVEERDLLVINNEKVSWATLQDSFRKNYKYTQSLVRQDGGIYQLDKNSDLIRSSAKDLLLVDSTIDFPQRYIKYNRKDIKVPALISGESDLARGTAVAVAMEGEVVATGKVLNESGAWAAIIKPANLKNTKDITLHQIN